MFISESEFIGNNRILKIKDWLNIKNKIIKEFIPSHINSKDVSIDLNNGSINIRPLVAVQNVEVKIKVSKTSGIYCKSDSVSLKTNQNKF